MVVLQAVPSAKYPGLCCIKKLYLASQKGIREVLETSQEELEVKFGLLRKLMTLKRN